MDNNNIKFKAILLTGPEATIVPCLAIVGAASIAGVIGYGAYKLGEKAYEKMSAKEDTEIIIKESEEIIADEIES